MPRWLALIVWGADPHALHGPDLLPSLHFGPVTLPGNNLFSLLCAILIHAVVIWFVPYTRYGLQMRLASADPNLAVLTGVDVERVFAISFVFGGSTSGLAGGSRSCSTCMQVVQSRLGSVPIAAITSRLIQALQEGGDHGGTFLAE